MVPFESVGADEGGGTGVGPVVQSCGRREPGVDVSRGNVRVRPAATSDINELIELSEDNGLLEHVGRRRGAHRLDRSALVERYMTLLSDLDRLVLVAIDEATEQLVGFAVLVEERSACSPRPPRSTSRTCWSRRPSAVAAPAGRCSPARCGTPRTARSTTWWSACRPVPGTQPVRRPARLRAAGRPPDRLGGHPAPQPGHRRLGRPGGPAPPPDRSRGVPGHVVGRGA